MVSDFVKILKAVAFGDDEINIFQQFVESLPVMFYAVDPLAPYKTQYVSPAFKAFGYPLQDWYENPGMWIRVMHPQDRRRILAQTEAARNAGGETDYEYRIVCQDKKHIWVRDRGCFIRSQNGEPFCWQGVMLDVSARKKAEADLRESEKRYRQMFEKNRAVKLTIDAATGKIQDANSAACEYYGYTLGEFRQKKINEINTLSSAEIVCELQAASKEKRNYFNFQHRLASGEIRDVEVHSSPIKHGNRQLLYSIIHDVTARKHAEAKLRVSEERYRTLFENANDLIYVHDLHGNYLSANSAALNTLGYTREEIADLNMKDIIVPEHLDLARLMLANKINDASETAYEIDCLNKNGERMTLEINSSIIYKEGKAVAVQGIARDITERKHTEAALVKSEENYRELFENANDLIYTHDLQGNFTSLNRAGELITGYSREEAVKMNISQVVAPEFLETARLMSGRKIAGEKPTAYELEIISKYGERVSLELSTRLIYQGDQPIGVQGIGRDITERKQTEKALIQSEQSYRFLSEGIMHQVWTATPDGIPDYVSRQTLEYFGKPAEEVLGDKWISAVHPDDFPSTREKWIRSLATGENYEAEFRLLRADGVYRWHLARASAGVDQSGKIFKWFGTNTDIDDQKAAEAKLNFFAMHDPLTQLPNRAQFMLCLEQAINRYAKNPKAQFAVLYLDLDRFKIINDSLGHNTGDKLLVAIAERLTACVRPGDVIARLGGDEFTILLMRSGNEENVCLIAERLQSEISTPFYFDNYEVYTTASIGVIMADAVKRKPEDYLRDADAAMYQAKANGKARYEIFDHEMHERSLGILELETDLRRAVERQEFEVYYQPIVLLDTGEILELEALIRWRHPERGLISPAEFISSAEETGLIVPIGEWILVEACRQIGDWQKRFPQANDLSVSVNLSAKQLLQPHLIERIMKSLAENNLLPRHLKLEVTESVVMEHAEESLKVLDRLNKFGIGVSTDDFGTGFSSLSYLHQFPFVRLKIDRSFISQIENDQKSEAIVKTILMLSQSLNIEAVAEGIENENQMDKLKSFGCHLGQGYLFSKPIKAEEVERLIAEGICYSQDEDYFSQTADQSKLIELTNIQ